MPRLSAGRLSPDFAAFRMDRVVSAALPLSVGANAGVSGPSASVPFARGLRALFPTADSSGRSMRNPAESLFAFIPIPASGLSTAPLSGTGWSLRALSARSVPADSLPMPARLFTAGVGHAAPRPESARSGIPQSTRCNPAESRPVADGPVLSPAGSAAPLSGTGRGEST